MRKNYVHLLLLLLLNISMFGQTVTLTPTLVNGVGYSGGSINLASFPTSTISLSVKVNVPSTSAVGDLGTIKIYFSKGTALGSNVANSGDGGALYFGGGKIATRSFVINLNWGDFLTSGGFIYAEYNNGTAYKSSNISVIKNSTMTSGTNINPPADAPNPNQIVNTLCCDQTIRLGDKPAPIVGSQYLNPYENFPYGIERYWHTTGSKSLPLDDINKILNLDYVTESGDFNISRWLGYSYKYAYEFTNKSNTIKIKVVPSPILINEISIDAPINSNGFVEIINTNNSKPITGTRHTSLVNLTILQDPFHVSQRGDSFANIERFEWEYTKTNIALGGVKNWIPINGENNYFIQSFNPSDISTTEDNYYLLRRIAIYQNIKRVSNTLQILLRTVRKNNTICCDQTLVISSTNTINQPTPIIGSEATPEANGYIKYQWQSQSIDSNNGGKISDWSNIVGATSKDYLPDALQLVPTNRRGETIWSTPVTYNYRRVTEPQYYNGQYSYSNEINLSAISYKQIPTIIVYPNPANSVINIENTSTRSYDGSTLSTSIITIVNIMGVPLASNNFSILNPNLISVNISNLSAGTYFINIQSASGDGTSQIITFIKQ